jgi:hypothetical protein
MCAKELAKLNDAWAEMALGLEPVPPSLEVEARLLARLRSEVLPPVTRSERKSSGWRDRTRFPAYVLAASLAGVVAGWSIVRFTPVAAMFAQRSPREIVAAETWGHTPGERPTTGFQTVALNTIAEKRGLHLSIVVIPKSMEWHVIATGLPALQEGEKPRLWLENKSGEITRSATLSIEGPGRGGAVVDLSEVDVADLAGVWLTQETHDEPARPSQVVLFRAVFK